MRFETSHIYGNEHSSPLDVFDPRCRVFCALAFSVALTSVKSLTGIFAGSLIPFLLLFTGKMKYLAKVLIHTNFITCFAWILLPLMTPGDRLWGLFSIPGIHLALSVTCKLNMISIVLVCMVAALGMGKINNLLGDFHITEKLRVLILLTMRYTFLLINQIAASMLAMRLRNPEPGRRSLHTFACMLGTTLIHSSDRAERSMLAMRCRGGMAGFSQYSPMKWRPRDTLLTIFFALNIVLIIVLSF